MFASVSFDPDAAIKTLVLTLDLALPAGGLLAVCRWSAGGGGALHPLPLFGAVAIAAIAGDTANFAVGGLLRERVERGKRLPLLKQEHLDRTRAFFDKHGPQAIILARFVPVVRTLAPFVAALGRTAYGRFLTYNVVGGLLWVVALVGAGYQFGNVGWIRAHLSAVLLGIVIVSTLPGLIGWFRQRYST